MSIYEGHWKNDDLGRGSYYAADGFKVYTGDWRKGQWHGMGKYYTSAGELMYEGQFLNSRFHGVGTLFFMDGESLVSKFVNGERVIRDFYESEDDQL